MKILFSGPANVDHVSAWEPLPLKVGVAVQFSHDDLSGTLNGVAELHVSNDKIETTVYYSTPITTASNVGNRLLDELYSPVGYYRYVWYTNDVTGGTVKATSEEESA